jgi:hypothetical protein
MSHQPITVLVVSATGSIGRLVIEEAARKGHAVRALARDPRKARKLLPDAEVVVGDLTRPDTLMAAVDGVNAIVFTHGSDGGGKAEAERVDHGGVPKRQGDRRHAGDSSDGVIARPQLAEVLVASLTSDGALRKTFELVASPRPQAARPRCGVRSARRRPARRTGCGSRSAEHAVAGGAGGSATRLGGGEPPALKEL